MPVGRMPKEVLDAYVEKINKYRHVSLRATGPTRSSYRASVDKTPFQHMDWINSYMHFRFVQVSERPRATGIQRVDARAALALSAAAATHRWRPWWRTRLLDLRGRSKGPAWRRASPRLPDTGGGRMRVHGRMAVCRRRTPRGAAASPTCMRRARCWASSAWCTAPCATASLQRTRTSSAHAGAHHGLCRGGGGGRGRDLCQPPRLGRHLLPLVRHPPRAHAHV